MEMNHGVDHYQDPDSTPLARPDSPIGDSDYGQEIPDFETDATKPPNLPPQLLQASLNSEAIGGDPSQLPEPHHVLLNHLYALSVKNHVLVLGATHRYR